MKRLALPLISLALLMPTLSQAHDAWIVPSATVLSGEEGWITVDAAIGNDKFYFNHHALSLNGLDIQNPNGTKINGENLFKGQLRSGFDVHLTDAGTYRIALVNNGIFARWKENGKAKRWFGSVQDYAQKVPQQAAELQVQQRTSRVETFATKGKPSPVAKITKGLSINPITHPNDLFAGETAKFIVTVDGEPAKSLEVNIVPEGSRYRDSLNAISLKTDNVGQFEVTWPQAGRYWIHTQSSDQKTTIPQAKKRTLSYSVTLEVLPQ